MKEDKLDIFTINQIKALILQYIFLKKLEENTLESKQTPKIQEFECYLMSKKWMSTFKEFYSFDSLMTIIDNLLQKLDINININRIEEVIFSKLDDIYIREIKEKENNYPDYLEHKINYNIKSNENFTIFSEFEILCTGAYDKIQKRKNISYSQYKKPFLINDKKIIIKFDKQKELLIGSFNNEFIPEFLFYYEDIKEMNEHFKFLKNNKFHLFKNNKFSDNGKELIKKKGFPIKKVGKIFEYKNNVDLKPKPTNDNNNSFHSSLNKEKKKGIEFLLRLYFYFEMIDYKINNKIIDVANKETGYIIKQDIIDKYKKFYDNEKIKTILNNEDNKKIVKNFKANAPYIIEKLLHNLIGELMMNLPKNYVKEINDKSDNELNKLNNYDLCLPSKKIDNEMQFDFFENGVILNEQLFFMIYDNNNEKIKENIDKLKVNYFFKDKLLILIFNSYINIGFLDESKIFKPDMIIKYENKEHFEKILNELNSLEYNNFKSIFKLKYNNVNIFYFILDKENKDVSLKIIPIESNGLRANNSFSGNKIKKKEKKNILIKSMSPDIRKINKKENIKKTKIELLKSINIQNKIKISKEENNNNLNFNQILYNIISALIDSEIIKKKMILPLKENNTFENYYLLNSDSLYKYIENNAMKNIYNYILDNRIIDNIFSEPNITTYEKDIIIEKVISKIDPNNLEQNKINSQFNKTLKDNENLLKFSYFYKNEHDYFTFYYNFIILTIDTIKLLFNDPFSNFSKIKDRIFPILLGDNKIFIEIIKGKQFSLEIGNLDKNNVFTPILFFDYFNENILDMNKISLMKNGYELYTQYFLLFRNDYFSPIFNKESNIVGNAYIYNSAINDYSEYLINKELEGIIELYFNDYILKEKFRDKKIINENFYILNKKYVQKIKDFYDYSNLEIELNKNKIVLETINAISLKTDDNEQNFLNKKN